MGIWEAQTPGLWFLPLFLDFTCAAARGTFLEFQRWDLKVGTDNKSCFMGIWEAQIPQELLLHPSPGSSCAAARGTSLEFQDHWALQA